jgi:Spy/CpxP family protein refolding chaperone
MMTMKMAKWIGITAVAAVALGGAMLVKAQTTDTNDVAGVTAPHAPRSGRGLLLGSLRSQLGLTHEQVTTIKTTLATDRTTLTTLMSSLHEARINLRGTIRKPGATEEDIRAASAKVAFVEADLAVERAKLYGKISPVLTPDQLAKMDELQQRADDRVDGAIVGFGRRIAQ